MNNKPLQKSNLAHAIQESLCLHSIPRTLILGLSCVCANYVYADQQTSSTADTVLTTVNPLAQDDVKQTTTTQQNTADQKIQNTAIDNSLKNFQSDAVYQLNSADIPQVDQSMVNEIYQVAEQAQQQAKQDSAQIPGVSQLIQAQKAESNTANAAIQMNEPAKSVDSYISELSQEQVQLPQVLQEGNDIQVPELAAEQTEQKRGFFSRLFHRDSSDTATVKALPKIKVTVRGAVPELNNNIEAKLSTFTEDAFEDYSVALPQIRTLTTQAAEALGYYHAQFKFTKTSDNALTVDVTANEPVKVTAQDIGFSGEGADKPAFMAIKLAPDLNIGDIFNHGLYETTKTRITSAASDQGYFDSYWRMHDVKVTLKDENSTDPQQKDRTDINLSYETGERYQLADVEFRMSDPKKPFPLKESVLRKLVPFQDGTDYASWRITLLNNNLINSRYFNYASVDVVKPDAIDKPLELPPDVKTLVEQQRQSNSENPQNLQPIEQQENTAQTKQQAVEESMFAGTQENQDPQQSKLAAQASSEEDENERLKQQARIDKKIPVIVTLNADKLNNLEAGFGYGTDTGFRIRSQYRRSIVNESGHSFESSLELSQIRQAIDASYSIPYKDPLNDYFNLVGGYEREVNDDIGQGVELDTESAVLGFERLIKKSLGQWQQNMSVRYRLDRITTKGAVDYDDIPDAFKVISDDPEQESLLFGYEISRTDMDNRVNPNRGFRQFYRIEAGTKSLLTETDMAILNAGWRFIYSLGENNDHQFVGRADLGYIVTDDFNRVPYNLRYFAGGDQSIRGYDYKSLSPEENDLLIGGQALAVGSLEYNYQFKPGWRGAVFADVGNAYDADFKTPTKYGVGLGLRWASPVGPIRIDVGAGISEDNIPIRLHVFIGPAL
ncbi:BamA/TamA family outer membrane protein [Acinetobacter qingfengensis]|uniref:Translocation and assembly module subunit TamA n=1 Tax=Acinetobacter qingfengensis TaxID=1262585 RepID=A0A1E7RAY4_9GAMM|nr:BamA/TamA family outer membrane protein [Acinetobacter qingfengensis]KAA8735108.1 BamA/TamA family outer membrane protein [Acinetobacter qingfengensis]OEY96442.1 hypothetical protein BJI46_12025 [Acinetobacter qingfengensis]